MIEDSQDGVHFFRVIHPTRRIEAPGVVDRQGRGYAVFPYFSQLRDLVQVRPNDSGHGVVADAHAVWLVNPVERIAHLAAAVFGQMGFQADDFMFYPIGLFPGTLALVAWWRYGRLFAFRFVPIKRLTTPASVLRVSALQRSCQGQAQCQQRHQ